MWISSCEADEAIGGLSGYPVNQSRGRGGEGDIGYLGEVPRYPVNLGYPVN